MNETSTRTTHDHNHDRPPATDRRTRPSGTAARGPHFAPARHLDPLRTVQGSLALYDCPDLATLDGHLRTLRRRSAGLHAPSGRAAAYRADMDRLLDRRVWLELRAR